jgi:hypothetical protein
MAAGCRRKATVSITTLGTTLALCDFKRHRKDLQAAIKRIVRENPDLRAERK